MAAPIGLTEAHKPTKLLNKEAFMDMERRE